MQYAVFTEALPRELDVSHMNERQCCKPRLQAYNPRLTLTACDVITHCVLAHTTVHLTAHVGALLFYYYSISQSIKADSQADMAVCVCPQQVDMRRVTTRA